MDFWLGGQRKDVSWSIRRVRDANVVCFEVLKFQRALGSVVSFVSSLSC